MPHSDTKLSVHVKLERDVSSLLHSDALDIGDCCGILVDCGLWP